MIHASLALSLLKSNRSSLVMCADVICYSSNGILKCIIFNNFTYCVFCFPGNELRSLVSRCPKLIVWKNRYVMSVSSNSMFSALKKHQFIQKVHKIHRPLGLHRPSCKLRKPVVSCLVIDLSQN